MEHTPESRIPTSGDPLSELPTGGASFQDRQIVANRYEILFRLGSGGMGEVWHAYDLKLRVDIALKSLRLDLQRNDDRTEALRREVRTAREVISPNVCRIFDLVVEEDRELISMEYIDGITLTALLVKKGSLELREARDIAAQFLAGLEAIHQAGLVHRDLKPENIMITRTGRVVVMDFGIAKQIKQVGGTISGTPPYMSPEQLAGEKVDARSDVFSAGVVLAEMIHPQGVYSQKTREVIWNAVRKRPLDLPESAWKAVIARAVAEKPENRFPSAGALARALEEVTLRVETVEERKPYPGLAAFTAADAEYFFGRELEVETVIKKLQQLHLMALIGPSGAGKTSFLRAGLIPVLPSNWNWIFCTPGDSPLINLAQALVPQVSGDMEAIQKLLRFEEPQIAIDVLGRWRKNHAEALLIIDRFEEVFTLNTLEVQSRFAEVIGRAALDADIRVLLAMRDDFLFHCSDHSPLSPIFSELTPLTPLGGPSLRRALVQPALKCNYRFEDETLVDEILADVEKERGALPLMAFAASKLWEKRDRQTGQLTRAAYKEIGGVAGALAQHAEQTMERIGAERQPIVREIFRNMITAQNTRAARDTEELLSVFPKKQTAEEVLRTLIDARLLTSFEAPQTEGEKPKRRVEIIHESLLSNWPRLVRWQTQDADSAQLRDQLRQAAQLWEQRSRSEDLLWTGAAYLEFQAWRQRYPGGLTTTEEAFAHAMVQRANKRRRQRRSAVVAMFVVLISVLGVISSFWRSERQAHEQTLIEARRAEASKVLTLGRNERDKDPTVALAYAVASLEISDSSAGRQFALEALSKAPPVSVEPDLPIRPTFLQFSPDGNWLAVGGFYEVRLLRRDGKESRILEKGLPSVYRSRAPQFSPNGDLLVWVYAHDPTIVRVWSTAKQKEIRRFKMEGRTRNLIRGDRLFLITDASGHNSGWKDVLLRSWDFNEKEPRILGRLNLEAVPGCDIDATGQWIAYTTGKSIFVRSIENLSAPARLIGEHAAASQVLIFHPGGQQLASADANGEIRLWSVAPSLKMPLRIIPEKGPLYGMYFNHSGSTLAVSYKDGRVLLWNFEAPQESEPETLGRNVAPLFPYVAFSPDDQWLVAAYSDSLALWPLSQGVPRVLRGDGDEGSAESAVDFTPDGKFLAAGFAHGSLYLWPWSGGATRILWKPQTGELRPVTVDPNGEFLGVGTSHEGALLFSIANGKTIQLPALPAGRAVLRLSFSPDGTLVAVTTGDDSGIRIWNLRSNEIRVLEASRGMMSWSLEFAPDGTLFSGDDDGNLRQWDLKSGTSRVVFKAPGQEMVIGSITFTRNNPNLMACVSGRFALEDWQQFRSELKVINLKDKTSQTLVSHGNRVVSARIDPTGNILITGDMDGIVRAGPITGEEPHLLFRHGSGVFGVAVHPTARWIASSEVSQPIIRIWPMPKGEPLQSLSHDQLLTRLRALTNIRIVADPATSTGYRIQFETFKGWEKAPAW